MSLQLDIAIDQHYPNICFQVGYKISPFALHCFHQVRWTNPDANIFLIHDGLDEQEQEKIQQFRFILVNSQTDLPLEQAQEFDRLYVDYSHPVSKAEFQLTFYCFKRFIHFKDLMKLYQLEWLFFCDCDVLIYKDINPLYQNTKGKYPYGLGTGGCLHNTFAGVEVLESFCEFMLDFYRQHNSIEKIIQICHEYKWDVMNDMVLTYHFIHHFYNKTKEGKAQDCFDMHDNPFFIINDGLVAYDKKFLFYLRFQGKMGWDYNKSIIRLKFSPQGRPYARYSRRPWKKQYFDLLHFSWFAKNLIYSCDTYKKGYQNYRQTIKQFLKDPQLRRF